MPHTIAVNGLTMSHKGSTGHAMNSTPDVCLTPSGPVPVPYSIISFTKDLVRGTTTVEADGQHMIAVKGSAHSKCTGDEPGSAKGVASGTNVHESTWITYSPNVFSEGKNVCRLSDKLFMNNKNCICGAGGEYEVPASISDPIMRELCKVFCETREEWLDCKRKSNSGKCGRPSGKAAKKLDGKLKNGNSGLRKALGNKVGAAEKPFFSSKNKIFDGVRKTYDKTGMQNALKRQVYKLGKKKLIDRGKKMVASSWKKLVPGLNVISGIADAIGTGMDMYEVGKIIMKSDTIIQNAIKVVPDFAVTDADGALTDIYDFKFDDPESGYQDKWQTTNKQEQAYKQALDGDSPKKVDNKTCECDKGPKKGRVPSV